MNFKSLSLSAGLLLTVLASSMSLLVQSAVADEVPLSDVTGITTTSSSQDSGLTTVYNAPTISPAVNAVAVNVNIAANITGSQTVGNVSGQAVTFVVTAPAATTISSLISGNGVTGYSVKSLQNFQNSGSTTIPVSMTNALANPANAGAVSTANALLSGVTNPSAALQTNVKILSLSLQGLSKNGSVTATQLLVAVRAYNAVINNANSSPGGVAALGDQIKAIQVVLGKMIDAAYAAK
jgi:hypothetical protein